MRSLVTLITPVYNGMPYIEAYFKSVRKQTYRPLQFICVNDGSTDATLPFMESEKERFLEAGIDFLIVDAQHGGQASACNEALPHIRGRYFTWCDADDCLLPESIERKVDFLESHGEYRMVRSNGKVIDGNTGEFLFEGAREEDKVSKDIFEDLFQDFTYCYAGCYLMETALLFESYPERRLPVSHEGQNLQLLLPAASRTECGYLDEILHVYCKRSDGHSSKKRSFTETLRRIQNFTKLRKEILTYCQCDKIYYEELAEKIEAKYKKQLYQSAARQAREERMK